MYDKYQSEADGNTRKLITVGIQEVKINSETIQFEDLCVVSVMLQTQSIFSACRPRC